jgi:outer membrane protein TolC
MKVRKWVLMAACFLMLGSGERAYSLVEQEDSLPANKVTLSDLISYAYRNNPSIRAARQAWRATLEDYRVVTGYPDPQFTFTYYPDPIETRLGPQDWNAILTQKIPFPGKLSKAGEVVESEARIANLKLDKTLRGVVMSLRESYHELIYIREAKRIANENLKLLNHLRKLGETAHAMDRATLLDVVKAQSQYGQLNYDIVLLSDLEQTEITRMNTLLSRPPGATIARLETVPFRQVIYDLDSLYSMAEERQEDILIAQSQIDRAEAKAELARLENRPDFKLGMFYGSIGTPDVPVQPPDAGRDALGVQFGITIPLWFNKNRGRTERAFAEMEMAKEEKVIRINDIRESIRSIFFRLENAKRLVTLYRNDLLPQASKAMEIAETWLQEGETSFSDFIETQSVWYNFQLTLQRAMADYGRYLARLERLVGQDLTRANDPTGVEKGKEVQ